MLDSTELDVGITTSRRLAPRAQGRRRARPSRRGAARAPPPPSPGTAPRTARTCPTASTRPSSPPRPGGDAARATTQITVDTAAPRLAGAAVSPASFSPNGDGQAETAAVAYSPAEACDVRVGILDAVRRRRALAPGMARAASLRSYTVAWDGRITSGGGLAAAAEGVYRFDIERRDEAGNIARQGLKVTLDKTLARPGRHARSRSPRTATASVTPPSSGFTLTRRASRHGARPGRRQGRARTGTGRPRGRRTLGDVGRPGRLRRVSRQLPAHVHRSPPSRPSERAA